MIRGLQRTGILGDHQMRRDLRLLCAYLRRELLDEGLEDVLAEVITLRVLALRHEKGDAAANAEIARIFEETSRSRLDLILRVLGIFFDFANVSEDLQRERVLRERRAEGRLTDGLPQRLRAYRGQVGSEARQRVKALQAEFVFTAHPTEAKRQTVRRILDRIRHQLRQLSDPGMTRSRRGPILRSLRTEVRRLMRTDPLHPHRPTVLEELSRALYVTNALWRAVPSLMGAVSRAAGEEVAPLRFGCWIGGDRDGHPHVTVETTAETLRTLRTRAINLHLGVATRLDDLFSVLPRTEGATARLREVAAGAKHPGYLARRERLHPREGYRHALRAIASRLRDTLPETPGPSPYRDGAALLADLTAVREAAHADGLGEGFVRHLRVWERRTRCFGLQLMRLDLRENSQGYRTLMRELLPLLGEDAAREGRDDLEGLWDRAFPEPDAGVLEGALSERSLDLLRVTRLMQMHALEHGDEGIGVNVISMTHTTADVLWVFWLHTLVSGWLGRREGLMPIAPLFETIDDLSRAAGMLRELFSHPAYAAALDRMGKRQTVMVGYSDSAKDGGYLAACHALYEGQEQMEQVAAACGVVLTCFHGRGGALGRGGGPAARAVSALPPHPVAGGIRMTEQGEVIADRFADATLAHRHMEQILGGLLVHDAEGRAPNPVWRNCMRAFAAAGRETYLALFLHPGFPTYFREATPVSCIEQLPIGSRPSRRHGAATLEDLRAIPYTFSWTQSRQLLNAFYGLGSAWKSLDRSQRLLTVKLYREWPFFRSMVDNAELALTKCDPLIAGAYAELVKDREVGKEIGGRILKEMALTREAILGMTERPSLMSEIPWLRRSVEIRKPFIDVLNLLQIEVLKRQRGGGEDDEAISRSLRLSVQGIAAGLRTTG